MSVNTTVTAQQFANAVDYAHDLSERKTATEIEAGVNLAATADSKADNAVSAVNKITYSASPASALRAMMNSGRHPVSITLTGDSTGNSDQEWFIRGLNQWMDNYLNYSFLVSNWNVSTLSYDDPINYQTGSSGEAHIELLKATNDSVGVDNTSTNLIITEDLDVAIKFSINDFASSTNEGGLIGIFSQVPGRAWYMGLSPSKIPFLWWSTDGSALSVSRSLPSAITIADDEVYFLRCTLDVDNDSGGYDLKFYNSTDDGRTWTQLQDTIVGNSTTSIFNSNIDMLINGRGSSQHNMKFYRAWVKNGIDGPIIASPNAGLFKENAAIECTDCQGNEFTKSANASDRIGSPAMLALNASASGQPLSYSTTHVLKQAAKEPDIFMISHSHNDPAFVNYLSALTNFLGVLRNINPYCPVVPVSQNPQLPPQAETPIYLQHQRAAMLLKFAANNSLYCIDAFNAFITDPNLVSLTDPDGVHLSEAGNQKWADLLKDFLDS